MLKIGKDRMPRLKQKLPTPVCGDNGIKTDVVVISNSYVCKVRCSQSSVSGHYPEILRRCFKGTEKI